MNSRAGARELYVSVFVGGFSNFVGLAYH